MTSGAKDQDGTEPVGGANLDLGVRKFHAQVNAEYAVRMPNGGTDIAERRRVAERVRAPWARGGPAMAETRNLIVGQAEIHIRIHRPTEQPGPITLIYVHGGGWMLFSMDTHDRLMREYAARANVTVIGIDYSLAPEARFPTPLQEIVGVVRWLRSPEAQHVAGSGQLVIGGDSAGANLALAASLVLRDAGEQSLTGMLLNYGAFDSDERGSHALYGGSEYMLTPEEMADFWSNYLPDESSHDPLARPLLADLHGLPPAFLCIAECDILADENIEMARRLAESGVEVTARIYKGATHSFLEAVSISAIADEAMQDASNWLVGLFAK